MPATSISMTTTESMILLDYVMMKRAEVAALEAEIAANADTIEKSKLKRSPKTLALISKNESLKRQIDALRVSFQDDELFLKEGEVWRAESAEVDAWAARGYTGTRPARIQRTDAAALKAFLAEAVSLPIHRHY